MHCRRPRWSRIDESVDRVLLLKQKRELFDDDPYVNVPKAAERLGTLDHLAAAGAVGDHGVTLVKNDASVLPLAANTGQRFLVAGYRSVSNTSQAQPAAHLAAAIERYGVTADLFETGTTPSAATIANAVTRASVSDLVVVATANASGTTSSAVAQRDLVSALIATGKPVVLIATRNPYDIAWIPQTSTYLATYSWTKPSMQAVARVLFGEINPSGKLPVTVPAPDGSVLYPYGHGLSY